MVIIRNDRERKRMEGRIDRNGKGNRWGGEAKENEEERISMESGECGG